MACGTEKGKLVIADYSPGFQYRDPYEIITKEDYEILKQAYYINFPQSN